MRKYPIGCCFLIDGTTYMLAKVEQDKYAMISLKTGNRYREPIVCLSMPAGVTEIELRRLGAEPDDEVKAIITVQTI